MTRAYSPLHHKKRSTRSKLDRYEHEIRGWHQQGYSLQQIRHELKRRHCLVGRTTIHDWIKKKITPPHKRP